MNIVKINGPGTLMFKGKTIRLPAQIKNVSDKELKLLKVMCRHHNVTYEIVGAESQRMASVAKKLNEFEVSEEELKSIDKTNVEIEDLFNSDDALGTLLGNLEKDKD